MGTPVETSEPASKEGMRSPLVMRGAEPIGPAEMTAAERRLGFALPQDLVELCLHRNCGAQDAIRERLN